MGAIYIQELVAKIGHKIGAGATVEANTPRQAHARLRRRYRAVSGSRER